MPRTLFAEMASPKPVPPKSTALSASPLATASAAFMQMTGYSVLSPASATPKSRTSFTRGSSRSWFLIKSLRFTPASSEPTATTYCLLSIAQPPLLIGGLLDPAVTLRSRDSPTSIIGAAASYLARDPGYKFGTHVRERRQQGLSVQFCRTSSRKPLNLRARRCSEERARPTTPGKKYAKTSWLRKG